MRISRHSMGALSAVLALVQALVSCAGAPPVAEQTGPSAPEPAVAMDEGSARRAAVASRFEREPLEPLYAPDERATLRGTALLVIDMQVGMMPIMNAEAVFAGIRSLVARADSAGAPVAWGYMDEFGMGMGSPAFELAAPLAESPRHYPYIKTSGNGFNGSGMPGLFDRAGVGTVVICGLSSGGCVNATVKGALALGYRVIVPSDTHTEPEAFGAQGEIDYWSRAWANTPGVTVMPSSEVAF